MLREKKIKFFVHSLLFIFFFPHSSMYVNSIYFMYDVQYIIIIVNLFLELICDLFHIYVHVCLIFFLFL